MKRILTWMVTVILFVSLVGCSSDAVKIEGHDWELTLVQSSEDGTVIGCASEHYEMQNEIEDIMVVDLVCSAENGNFTITDKTNGTSYYGNYEISEESGDSTIYSITTAESTGMAVASITKSDYDIDEEDKVPTLIITIEDYTLNFQAD